MHAILSQLREGRRARHKVSRTRRFCRLRLHVKLMVNFPKPDGVGANQSFDKHATRFLDACLPESGVNTTLLILYVNRPERPYNTTPRRSTFRNQMALMRLNVSTCTPSGFRYATVSVGVEA